MVRCAVKIEIRFRDTSLSVADIVERRWWRSAKRYTVALYAEHAGGLWINDETNDRLDDEVVLELEAARATALGIQSRETERPR